MTTKDLTQKHWNYYLMLEQKLLETRNYVEFARRTSIHPQMSFVF